MALRSLRSKLGTAFWTFVAIIVLSGVLSIYFFNRLSASIDKILVEDYQSVLAGQNLIRAFERQYNAQLSILTAGVENASERFNRNGDRFRHYYNLATRGVIQQPEALILDSLIVAYREYLKLADWAFQLGVSDRNKMFIQTLQQTQLRLYADRVKDLCFQLAELNEAEIMAEGAKTRNLSLQVTAAVSIASLVALVLSVVAVRRFTRTIIHPAERLTALARNVSRGRLNQKIDIDTDDEIGELSVEFNKMTERLRGYEELNISRILMEKRKSEAIVASIGDPVIVVDSDQKIVLLNNAAKSLLLVGEIEWLDHPVADIVRHTDALKLLRKEPRLPERLGKQETLLSFEAGSESMYFQPMVTEIKDEKGILQAVILFLRNVTEFKKLDRMKSEFMAVVSHELRTPLTSLALSVDLLAQNVAGPLTKKQLELLKASKDDCNRLNKLVREILHLSKLESGSYKLQRSKTDLGELVGDIIRAFNLQAKEKNVVITAAPQRGLPSVNVDKEQCGWVINNLISNALRYTPPGGSITIRCAQHGDWVETSVRDTGPGIPKEALETIFNRFVQVRHGDEHTPGSVGLGLAIAKEVVEAHGGSLWAESEVGNGSEFIFTLPME
jgi:signal transduction histidine kinase